MGALAELQLVRRAKAFFAFLLAFALVGCAQTLVMHREDHREADESVSVLLMPVDIELSALTAGGVSEVRADWTATAKTLVSESLDRQLLEHNDKLLEYVEPQDPELLRRHNQLVKLHSEVGGTIFLYTAVPAAMPPTKKDSFDWSLGEEASMLRDAFDADYGLFVFIRDSYATAGRKVMMVTSAMLGVSLAGGAQVGFATLVDLDDGSIVWFNRLVSQTGDLRTPGPADKAVMELIKDIPL